MSFPNGWVKVRLGDIIEPIETINPTARPAEKFRYVDIGAIDSQRLQIAAPKTLAGREAPSRARRRIRVGDVLFSTVRPYLKKIAMVPSSLDGEVTSTGICVLRPSTGIESRFLFRRVASQDFIDDMTFASDGTMYPAISDQDVFHRSIVLPPFAEQRRIVAKLDALMARLARARAELDRVSVLANRMCETGLRRAFPTNLFNGRWEEEGSQIEWETVRFDEAANIASNLVTPETIPDLPHIAPNHIASGRPKLLPYRTIREDAVISSKHHFFPGQLLYSKIRPYLRKVVQVDFEGGCSADMYPISPTCHPRYLMYWMLSPQFTWLATRKEGRTVLPKINMAALGAIPTPLAPLDAQEWVAARLGEIFARADRLEAEAARARALLDRLEAAILAKAFRGELVPQDPNDEPASVLLDRIRAQRAAAPAQQRNRRRAKSPPTAASNTGSLQDIDLA